MPQWLPLAIGGFGQALYAFRCLHQWHLSEKAGRVVVPRLFWILGLCGACCAITYAVLTQQWVFLFAVTPTLYIYGRNLMIHKSASVAQLAPVAVVLLATLLYGAVAAQRGKDAHWIVWEVIGSLGAAIYSGRYLIQWWVSERRGQSQLPPLFWWLSIVGSVLLTAFGVVRMDWIMILAFSLSPIPYGRNLWIALRANRAPAAAA